MAASHFFFVFSLQLLFSSIIMMINLCDSTKFPALLVFGDSLLDTGNNNFIATPLKANHFPYGLSFPGTIPTGRFSNGKLLSDFIASSLGIKSTLPPALHPKLSEADLRTGVCFASAGSGYDDITAVASGVIPVSTQPQMLATYINQLKGIVGEEQADRIINQSLVLVTSGSNDFGINFYDSPTRSIQFTVEGYQDYLHGKIHEFIKALYGLGCRNMLIAGLPPLGCGPMQMTVKLKADRTCVENENADAQLYNRKLEALLPKIQASLPGAKLVYADIYTPLMEMVSNPQKHGFVVTNRGCCGTGFVEVGPLCNSMTPVCPNPSQYLFWDAVHPSEAAYQYISKCWEEHSLPKF